MSDERFSFSMSLDGGASGNADRTRYIAPPFDARMADSGQALVLIHGEATLRRLPVQLVQVYGQCNRFRSRDEHVEAIARALRVPSHQTAAIARALDELIRDGLLLSESDVLDRLTDPPERSKEPPSGPIGCLFIRTCGRPEALDRLLRSLRRPVAPPGLERVVVLDDEAGSEGQRATREVVENQREGFPHELKLIDPSGRRRILDRMAREAGADAEQLRWFIEGDADDPEDSYGASLNFALLLGAGGLITIVDDDATLEAYELPESDSRPAFRRRQSSRLSFPEPDEPLPGADCAALETHPVALHAGLLGIGIGELAAANDGGSGELLDDLDPQLLSELSADSRIRLTSSGTLGDPGTRGIQWLFTEPAEHLRPLCRSEDRYRTLIEQRRMARSARRPEVTTAFALMTTTMTGIDNRELLLPTQPRGANEDLLFGALVGFLHPDTCQANLPHMLYHMRPDPRRWQPSDLDEARGVTRGGFLTAKIHALRSSLPQGDADSRARLLGEALGSLARCDRDQLAWQLRQELLEVRSQMIEKISSVRESLSPPAWLDADFARVIERHGRIEASDEERVDEIAEGLPRFLDRYAAALGHWIASWRNCRELGMEHWLDDAPA